MQGAESAPALLVDLGPVVGPVLPSSAPQQNGLYHDNLAVLTPTRDPGTSEQTCTPDSSQPVQITTRSPAESRQPVLVEGNEHHLGKSDGVKIEPDRHPNPIEAPRSGDTTATMNAATDDATVSRIANVQSTPETHLPIHLSSYQTRRQRTLQRLEGI